MLDPKEQAKGGFGAQADRARERREAITSAGETAAAPATPTAAGSGARDQADGADAAATPPESDAVPGAPTGSGPGDAPTARRRWH